VTAAGAREADVTAGLPLGWRRVALDEVCRARSGGTPSRSRADYYGGDVPWAKIEDLTRSGMWLRSTDESITELGLVESSARVFPPGTVLFAMYASIGTASIAEMPVATNQAILGCECSYEILPEFLWFWFSFSKQALLSRGRGGTQANLNAAIVRSLQIPLPPPDEQRRIVTALDAILGRLNATRARLARVPEILKRYRASLLKAACEGRLVPNEAELARAEGRDYEPADQLLVRILEERRAKWEEGELAKFAKAGKAPPANWRAKYKEPQRPDASELPELPEGWWWTTVEAILREPLRNGHSVRDAAGGFPVLRLSALKDGRIDLTRRKAGEWTAEEAKPYLIQRGDFLIARGNGSLSLVGVGGLVEQNPDPVAHPDTLIRVRPETSAYLPRFFRVVWNSQLNRQWIERTARTSAGIFKVSQEDISPAVLPLPPLAEQRRIVAAVERQLAAVERIEATAAANLRRCEQMRETVLAKAFRGDLV
jgi:type I restriction enzyme S subunit